MIPCCPAGNNCSNPLSTTACALSDVRWAIPAHENIAKLPHKGDCSGANPCVKGENCVPQGGR
jgi:hypothetical protein